jgi:hypothetical protein
MANTNKVLLIVFLLLFFILAGLVYTFRNKIGNLIQSQNTNNVLTAKVVSWNSERSELLVTITDKGSEKYNITIDPSVQRLIIAVKYVDDNGRPKGDGSEIIKNEDDKRWKVAFCPGDAVRLISGKIRIGVGTLNEQKLSQITIIQNEGPRACK